MVKRGLVIAGSLHALYAATWLLLDSHAQEQFERYVTAAAMVIAAIFYAVLIVAFYWARKSRLNLSLAVQKFYWLLLITLLALPNQIGSIVNDQPYSANSYALWSTPTWMRTYIWIGVAISIVGVLWEFYDTNWGDEDVPLVMTDDHVVTQVPVERRSGLERRRNWRPKEWGKG